MSTFLKEINSKDEINVKDIAERLLSTSIISVERLGGGLNSRVYQLVKHDSSSCLLKFYYRGNSDRRDRLKTEYSSLSFLWQNGIKNIPEPLAVSESEGCAVFEFIAGEIIPSKEVTSQDIEHTVRFLRELKELRNLGGFFPPASEAFFSIRQIIKNIQMRLQSLKEVERREGEFTALQEYLDNEFIPFWQVLTGWVERNLFAANLSYIHSLSESDKTLSPSDFGFHNALRNSHGQIVFVDFEHFGWDDPAKVISDFVLHPAMTLSEDLKQQFVTGVLELFKECRELGRRVKILFPLFGLKWCLIFLNEFIPSELRRRDFAQTDTIDRRDLYQNQLLKAKKLLGKIRLIYQKFPYDVAI